ncbi:MAG: hypothetical protein QOG20_2590 [Pseudonocardiales bacterium]|nr:hypothetical protein [Pseudonocardiales bacterium]
MRDARAKNTDATMRRVDAVVGLTARLAVRSGRRRRPAPPVDRNLRLVVADVRAEAPDVAGVTLVGAGPLPGWRPGAHLDVVLPSGLVRQYSLCGDPDRRDEYRIAVRRIGPGSSEVHALRPGTPLTVRGPRNAFPFVAAPRYLFLAGGIGITPLAAMARAATSEWRLIHTGRDRASLPLSRDLDPRRVVLRPDDEHGGPPTAAELLDDLTPGTTVYCCGPSPMIDAVRRAMPAGQPFHAERFSPPPIRGGRPFTLGLRDGTEIAVPAGRSALDALLAVRPDVAYSCRQGFCGTCHVGLLGGGTEHDTAAPGRTALCVGRATGEHVIVDL